MRNYYNGVPVIYTAVASTVGRPLDTFTYAWSFDDATTGSGASIPHAWYSMGIHTATVEATDDVTGSSATASKTINVQSVPTKYAEMFTRFAMTSDGSRIVTNAYGGGTSLDSLDYGFSYSPNNLTIVPGALSMSSDARVIIAIQQVIAKLYVSLDYGITWFYYHDFGNVRCSNVSGDGSTLTLGDHVYADTGFFYYTTDNGISWANSWAIDSPYEHLPYGPLTTYAIASSFDGSYIYTFGHYNGTGPGPEFIPYWGFGFGRSTDHGHLMVPATTGWSQAQVVSLATTTTGNIVLGAGKDYPIVGPPPLYNVTYTGKDYLYLSIDYGMNYTQIISAGQRPWGCVCMSGDGTKMAAVAVASGDTSLFTSIDSGVTWVSRTVALTNFSNWEQIAMSSNGLVLVATYAAYAGSRTVTSFDMGDTWF